jgi:hypothetical protein
VPNSLAPSTFGLRPYGQPNPMSNDQQSAPQGQQEKDEGRDEQGRDRPDLRGPRGNPKTDQADVDHGRERIDSIVSW